MLTTTKLRGQNAELAFTGNYAGFKVISTRLAMARLLLLLLFPFLAAADPLAIDLTKVVPPAATCPYGPGTTRNPQGETITADQRSFFLDGKPWIPIVGEFHYIRYPRAEWRDELLKVKAGGINTISTYVFWIHHEEAQGTFDWSDNRSLRDFIKLCQDVGLNREEPNK